MSVGVATAGRIEEASFASAAQLREVFGALLESFEADPELAARLRSARVSYRYVFTDFDLDLDVDSAGEEGISWSFSGTPEHAPAVTLEMSSEVANRYLQGRESLAIGLARKRIRYSGDARAALKLLSVSRYTSARYRELIASHYPHLLLD
jgi:hypothetical protein